MNKFIDNYDEIIDTLVEEEFIKQFLSSNKDYNILIKQLEGIYKLEYEKGLLEIGVVEERVNPLFNEMERELLFHIYARNKFLITKCSAELLLEEVENEYKEILKDFLISYENSAKRETINALKVCIFIHEKLKSTYILGKERDIEKYKLLLEELTREEEKNVRVREDK